MANVVEVRFKKAGKAYSFDTAGIGGLEPGISVVTETARGLEVGKIISGPIDISDDRLVSPLKPVVRIATEEDVSHKNHICKAESQAIAECRELVERLNLPMKCLTAEYNLDETHVTVYFSAEGRIDFRDLVRELGRRLRTRVELRQIGPRDEAKLLGGFGRCGREFCCASYLAEFEPVSIKMAKEQNLPLNPLKISGVCGRLLCCLSHEYEIYKELNAEKTICGSNCASCAVETVNTVRRPLTSTTSSTDISPSVEADDSNEAITGVIKPIGKGRRRRRRR